MVDKKLFVKEVMAEFEDIYLKEIEDEVIRDSFYDQAIVISKVFLICMDKFKALEDQKIVSADNH